jgi:hypothetical protein
MPLAAQELRFAEMPFTRSAEDGVNTVYTASMMSLGSLMHVNTGTVGTDKWVGPLPVAVARPLEQSTPSAINFAHVIPYTNDVDWIFGADNGAAAATRRFMFYEYDRRTASFNWRGSTLVTLPGTGNVTIRGFRMARYLYTTGTIAVNAGTTTVGGNGSTWTTDRQAVGARIGFGSTDPTQISTWYTVAAIPSNVQITLGQAAGTTYASGSPYVIEELRALITTTNATAQSGGLFIVKGLNPDHFTQVGTVVAAATTTDNSRSCYYLTTNSNQALHYDTASCGIGLDNFVSWQSHSVYHLNGGGTAFARVTKYNTRAGTTLTAGRDPGSTVVVATALQATPAGNLSQNNNGRTAVLAHGPASGVDSLFFVTTNRIARAPLSSITAGATNYILDSMTEVPPGSANTFPAGGVFSAVEHMGSIDRLFITSTGATSNRHYITQYRTDSGQMDHILGVDTKQQDQASGQGPAHPSINAAVASVWVERGRGYLIRLGTTAAVNQMYMVPVGADNTYASATQQYIITPKISTPGAIRFRSVAVANANNIGTGELALPPGSFTLYVRTSGIDDNSGGWTEVNQAGEIGFIGTSSEIQFRIAFETMHGFLIPARLYNLIVTYDTDDNILPELEWNLNDSNLNDGTVGFSQNAAFSSSVPNFDIEYYRSDTNALVLSQNSLSTTNGTFQWFSGSVWTGSLVPNGLGPNTVGTRRRFVPTVGLPASVNVYPKIKV